MKEGDLCKCISNFESVLPDELTLYKGDLFQILRKEDKLWTYGIGGGGRGKVPISCLVEIKQDEIIPPHKSNEKIFAVISDFNSAEEGDLPLMKGTLIVGENAIDDAWWYGRWNKHTGVFPLNFVWQIDMTLMQSDDESEKPVQLIGRALQSFIPQLEEELQLTPGEVIKITHCVQGDWFRGECHGKVGIFPKNFVSIVDENEISYNDFNPSPQEEKNISSTLPDNSLLATDSNSQSFDAPPTSLNVDSSNNLTSNTSENDVLPYSYNIQPENKESTVLSKMSDSWKHSTDDNNDVFNDDYFKMNMPSVYKEYSSSVADSMSNISTLDNKNNSGGSSPIIRTNTITREVDEHFDSRNPLRPSLSTNVNRGVLNSNRYDREVDQMLNVGYNEDNTGIKPYGKAAYDFHAQYPNELSFCKDEIIYLIKHIDSHWTMGRIEDDSGIFPTSYVDVIVDCVDNTFESFLMRPTSITDVPENEGYGLVEYDFTSSESGDVSVTSGQKIKILENIDSSWAIVVTETGERGMCPRNHFKLISESDYNSEQSSVSVVNTTPNDNLISFDSDDEILSADRHRSNYLKTFDPIKELHDVNIDLRNMNLSENVENIPKQQSDFGASNVKENTSQPLVSETPIIAKDNSHSHLAGKPYNFTADTKKSVVEASDVPAAKRPQVLSRQPAIRQDSVVEESRQPAIRQDSIVEEDSHPSEETLQKGFPSDLKSTSQLSFSGNSPLRPAPPPPCLENFNESSKDSDVIAQEAKEKQRETIVKLRQKRSVEKENSSTFYTEVTPSAPAATIQSSASMDQEEAALKHQFVQRKEVIQELVTTEHEYIHDLEAMVQVASVTAGKAKEANVDLPTLMNNLNQVAAAGKSLLKALQKVSYEPDHEIVIGKVFVDEAEQLGEAYKVYCAHHTTLVEPLLSQYQADTIKKQYLELVLQELQQHKIQLLDMRSVLIKPVQRILKYPLFLDRLLSYTPSSHPDYKMLQQARQSIANVANLVNTHTKRMDMVMKYGSGSSLSQQVSGANIRKRISVHSLAKKKDRVTTRVTAYLGLTTLSEDARFNVLIREYRELLSAIKSMSQHAQNVLSNVRDRQLAELSMVEGLASLLLSERNAGNSKILSALESSRTTAREIYNGVVTPFENTMSCAVISPLVSITTMVSTTERLLVKRDHKLLDFNMAQQKLDRNKDPTRTRILEEEYNRVRSDYDALNEQLIDELPLFNASASAVLNNSLLAFISARIALQGRLASKFCSLKQDLGSTLERSEDMKLAASTEISKLSFVSDYHFRGGENTAHPHHIPRHGKKRSDSSVSVTSLRPQAEATKRNLMLKYQNRRELLYLVNENHSSSNPVHLSLAKGTVVACLKDKDPSGSNTKWYVDDGSQKGFVQSSVLVPYLQEIPSNVQNPTSNIQNPTSNVQIRNPATNVQSPASNIQNPASSNVQNPTNNLQIGATASSTAGQSNPSRTTQNKSSIAPRVPTETRPDYSPSSYCENPPKYEDIFPEPSPSSAVSVPSAVEEPAPLEDKEFEACANNHYEEISENVYEDLDSEENDSEPQFYYALYKFGGDASSHQLSLYEGQVVMLLHTEEAAAGGHLPSAKDWYFVQDRQGEQGYVPASYLSKYSP